MSLYMPSGGPEPLRYDSISLGLGFPPRPDAERKSLKIRRSPTSLDLSDPAEPPPERRKDVRTGAWLARLAGIVEPPERGVPPEPRAARIDRAVYFVLDTFDDLLFARNEVRCREILWQADAERLPIEVLLTLLGATLRARDALDEARRGLCRRVEERLRRDVPDRVDLLLRGLR